jgi:hypothetical protein
VVASFDGGAITFEAVLEAEGVGTGGGLFAARARLEERAFCGLKVGAPQAGAVPPARP